MEEVYFRPGEVVNAGQAVIALLPPGNLKVRFFVAEPVRAALAVDQTIKVTCDGCPGELPAKISFIAREAEFTPAGDLLARAAGEARLPGRGAALGGGGQAHRRPAGDGEPRARRANGAAMKEIAIDVEG